MSCSHKIFTKALPPPVDPVLPPPKEPPDATPLSFLECLAANIQRKTVALPMYDAAAATLDMDFFPLNFLDDIVHVPIISKAFTPIDLTISKVDRLANDIHLAFNMPYDIGLSPSPFDNQTTRDFL